MADVVARLRRQCRESLTIRTDDVLALLAVAEQLTAYLMSNHGPSVGGACRGCALVDAARTLGLGTQAPG